MLEVAEFSTTSFFALLLVHVVKEGDPGIIRIDDIAFKLRSLVHRSLDVKEKN